MTSLVYVQLLRKNVHFLFIWEYRGTILRSSCGVIDDVITMKIFFLAKFGTIFQYLMPIWSCNEYLKKFQNDEILRAGANFFIGSVTGSSTHYQKSQENNLHFELLIHVLAQILGKLWQFQNLTYFFTWWRHLWRHQHQNVYSSSANRFHICAKFGVDCSNGAACVALITDKQTDRQTQIDKRTYLPKLKILASNKSHIGRSPKHVCSWSYHEIHFYPQLHRKIILTARQIHVTA